MLDLSPDQAAALAAIMQALTDGAKELVLSGPAGSGKTTLARVLLDTLEEAGYRLTLVAPTGKAASRLSALTGREATTIHSPLYKTIKEAPDKPKSDKMTGGGVEFADPKAIASGKAIIFCDEASMVGSKIAADLRRNLGRDVVILYVGDREQLPPVNDVWGADFANPTALLTQVHRQAADSPIIQLATAIRQGEPWRNVRPDGVRYSVRRSTIEEAAAWLACERATGGDVTLLAYTNRVRQRCNAEVRAARGHGPDLTIGDVIVCTRNSYPIGIMNGEVRQVADFEPIEGAGGDLVRVTWQEGGSAPILAPATLHAGASVAEWERLEALADAIDDDADEFEVFQRGPTKRRMLLAEHGECLTVHKSQGSQWHSVGIVFDSSFEGMEARDAETFRRLLYTAVTRASTRLVLFDVGRA